MKSDYTIIVTALSNTLTDGKRLAILDVFDVSRDVADAIEHGHIRRKPVEQAVYVKRGCNI
jgi:hypothetical protein